MPKRRADMYERVLDLIRLRINPQVIIMDFEKPAENAFRAVFPNANIHGCFFHFCQAVYRRVLHLGWADQYKSNAVFAKEIRRIMCLSFVHPDDVVHVYQMLFDEFETAHGEQYGAVSIDKINNVSMQKNKCMF